MIFGWLTPLLTLAAFILLLLVTLSTPIIKSIYLYKVVANISGAGGLVSITGNARFGVWGYCTSAITGNVRGFVSSEPGFCTPKHLGYTIDANLAKLVGLSGNYANIITKALTAVLILHPIAAGLSLLALIFGLLMARPQHAGHTTRISSFLATLTSLIAAIITTAIFVVDIVFGAVLTRRLHKAVGNDVSVHYGNAVWMTLAATILLWLAVITATCGIFQLRRHRRAEQHTTY